jgi:hypothetical protein
MYKGINPDVLHAVASPHVSCQWVASSPIGTPIPVCFVVEMEIGSLEERLAFHWAFRWPCYQSS